MDLFPTFSVRVECNIQSSVISASCFDQQMKQNLETAQLCIGSKGHIARMNILLTVEVSVFLS